MGLVDFTNPDAVEWYKDKLRKLLDMGVDCFKTDFGGGYRQMSYIMTVPILS